ncbi:MAG: O-antigen ligase family protein [Clostridia bacterium]|nr:O-antigen ligase family protein [Clostridia bacterium]
MNNSVLLSLVYNFVFKLMDLYSHSSIHKGLEALSSKVKELFSGSAIWYYLRTYENTSRFFEQSFFLRSIQGCIDGFLSVLRKVFVPIWTSYTNSKAYDLLQNSLLGMIIKIITDRFVLILCFFIFIHTTVPYHSWHNQYGAALIILITLLYLVKASSDIRYGLDIKRMDFALVLFIISVLIGTFTSITPSSSIRTLVFNGMSFLLVLLIVNVIKSGEDIGTMIYWIIAAITATSLLGFYQYIKGVPVDPTLVDVTFSPGVGRVFSSMGNPNNYAEYLVLTLPFFGAAFFNTKNPYMKAAIAGLSVLPLVNLVLTSSRSGWIGFVASVFVFIFFKNRKLIPLAIVMGILAIPLIPSSIIDRLNTIGKDTSTLYRLKIWEGSWRIVEDFWATGLGLGQEPFQRFFNKYTSAALPAHSHMLPLQIWVELGLLGIVSFVWMVVRLVKKSMICIFEKKNEGLNNIIIACISSLTGILVIGLFEYVWFYPRILTMFWIDISILMAALNLQNLKTGIPLPRE